LSRRVKNPELLAPYQVSSPLWQTNPTLMVQPLVPRTAEVAGAADASPLVSVVGAVWLLMGQPTGLLPGHGHSFGDLHDPRVDHARCA
jgi:hypothetical protein